MVKGANCGHGKVTPSAPKSVVRLGNVAATPKTTGYSSMARRQVGGSKAQEVSCDRASRIKHEDPKSGSYERYTTQDRVSRKNFYKEGGSGRVGVKDEVKSSSTVKVGDKRGYTEYYKEDGRRNVNFHNGSHNYGSNRQLPANDNHSHHSNDDSGLQSYGSDSDYSNNSDLQTHGYDSDASNVQSYSCESDSNYDQDSQSCSNASDDNCSDEHQSYSTNDGSDNYYSDGGQSYSNGSDDYRDDDDDQSYCSYSDSDY